MTAPFKLLLAIPNLIILHIINLYKSVSETLLTWEIALLLENGNQFPLCHFPGKGHFEKKITTILKKIWQFREKGHLFVKNKKGQRPKCS